MAACQTAFRKKQDAEYHTKTAKLLLPLVVLSTGWVAGGKPIIFFNAHLSRDIVWNSVLFKLRFLFLLTQWDIDRSTTTLLLLVRCTFFKINIIYCFDSHQYPPDQLNLEEHAGIDHQFPRTSSSEAK